MENGNEKEVRGKAVKKNGVDMSDQYISFIDRSIILSKVATERQVPPNQTKNG